MDIRKQELDEDKKIDDNEKEKEKRNSNFVMFYRNNMAELRWLMDQNPLALKLLFFIVENMDYHNALACSYSVFVDFFQKTRNTIYKSIKFLKDNGFIDTLKMGTSSVYIINQEIAWSSWSNQKKYAKFDGKILVSHKENIDYNCKAKFEKLKRIKM